MRYKVVIVVGSHYCGVGLRRRICVRFHACFRFIALKVAVHGFAPRGLVR